MQVQCSRISLAFADRDILDKANMLLSTGSRAALAGVNGSGKSTLMQIIAGIRPPDSGEISVSRGCRISYLPQSGLAFTGAAGRTLREEAETAYQNIAALLEEMETLGKRLESAAADDKTVTAMVEEHHRLSQTVEDSGYYRREEQIEQILGGLGFSRPDLDKQCASFSGGWQMRIALAKLLLENPDIMLLDEPTNYLDIEARTWLESWLKRSSGAYLLVSHDRYFLDTCVTEVYEIFQGTLKRYAGNYTAYEKTREGELESLLKRYAEQQEEIAKSEALIQRFRYKASKAAMVQERIKKLEKMERVEIPESLKKISISFPPAPHSGRIALTLENIGRRYGEKQVLAGLNLTIDAGERLVVAGKNGAGKTTLLRIIAGNGGAEKTYEGTVSYGAGIVPGYFSQDSAEELGKSESVLSFMEAAAPTALIPRVRDMLGAFLFRGDDVYKSLAVLSGGEKSRLALLRLLLRPVNLLVLDEPTNHLDIHSKDVLLDALKKFIGTIIFVSHDRAFMEALSTKTLELRAPELSASAAAGPSAPGPSTARLFYGGYGYYLERLEQDMVLPEAIGQTAAAGFGMDAAGIGMDAAGIGMDAADSASLSSTSSKPDFAQSLPPVILIKAGEQRVMTKQRQTLLRRLERQEEEILAELEKLEAEKTRLEEELSKPECYSKGEQARAVKAELDNIMGELETKTAVWEAKAAELEQARLA
ncbi:ABC transporter ATP-binding protein [Spirochaetia bacterium]|nr:ABC transporter ATP-binding protein [Spirochaetia bacterium]